MSDQKPDAAVEKSGVYSIYNQVPILLCKVESIEISTLNNFGYVVRIVKIFCT